MVLQNPYIHRLMQLLHDELPLLLDQSLFDGLECKIEDLIGMQIQEDENQFRSKHQREGACAT